VLFLLMAACGSAPAPTPTAAAPEAVSQAQKVGVVDVAALASRREAGEIPLLLDVRTPAEFAAGHIPGAVNVPLGELDTALPAALAGHEGDEIYLVCQSGRRSARAARTLSLQGIRTVNVSGGTAAWIAAGHPVE